MAQRVITLAKEETSQEILTAVNQLKTAAEALKTATAAISDAQKIGGGRIRKYYEIKSAIYDTENTVTVQGKCIFTMCSRRLIGSEIREYDGIQTTSDMSLNFDNVSFCTFAVMEKLVFRYHLPSGGGYNRILFSIDWQDEVGTVTVAPASNATLIIY